MAEQGVRNDRKRGVVWLVMLLAAALITFALIKSCNEDRVPGAPRPDELDATFDGGSPPGPGGQPPAR